MVEGAQPPPLFSYQKQENYFPPPAPKKEKKQVARSEPCLTCLHGRLIAKCTTSATHIIGKNIVFIMVIGLSGVQFGL